MAMIGVGCTSDSVQPSGEAGVPLDAAAISDGATSTASDAAADAGVFQLDAPPPVDFGPLTAGQPQDPQCDLNGRWLVAQRVLATAAGQSQASHNWFYYEVHHQGAGVVVTKGLHCGYEVVKKSALGASVDSSAAWPAFLQKNSSAGRQGTFVAEGSMCHLKLDREYTVRGATVAFYVNPANKMPDRTQPATATTPGWEDWDGDGNPGFSLKVSSALLSGTLYTCQRDWTIYDGTTPASAAKLKVAITYDGEQVALGRSDGSSALLEVTSAPSSDPTQHYAWFQRLTPDQATGSDAEICAAVRALKDTLVPEAND
jgi:hypothetical protein